MLLPKYMKKMRKFGLGVLTGKLCPLDLNLTMKPVKKVFVYKCNLSLSLALLYLAYMFINKIIAQNAIVSCDMYSQCPVSQCSA